MLVLLGGLAAEQPLVLIVEDAHWADPSTRDFLSFLIRNRRRERLVVAVTYRTDELHRRHPLRAFLAEADRSRAVTRLSLERFTRGAGRAAERDPRSAARRPSSSRSCSGGARATRSSPRSSIAAGGDAPTVGCPRTSVMRSCCGSRRSARTRRRCCGWLRSAGRPRSPRSARCRRPDGALDRCWVAPRGGRPSRARPGARGRRLPLPSRAAARSAGR